MWLAAYTLKLQCPTYVAVKNLHHAMAPCMVVDGTALALAPAKHNNIEALVAGVDEVSCVPSELRRHRSGSDGQFKVKDGLGQQSPAMSVS